MNEDEFEQAIVDLAHVFGWYVVGHRPARTKHGWRTPWKYDGKGWPDLTLVHPERGLVVLAELKVPPNTLSDDQELWRERLEELDANRPAFAYRVWTPDDSDEIARTLSFDRLDHWNL